MCDLCGDTVVQTRLHLIKQEQTERKLLFVIEIDFKEAKHYLERKQHQC